VGEVTGLSFRVSVPAERRELLEGGDDSKGGNASRGGKDSRRSS
jgi:hypothetical protein